MKNNAKILAILGTSFSLLAHAFAQPPEPSSQDEGNALKIHKEPAPPSITLAELETLIGGRTTLKLAAENSAPTDIAKIMAEQTGLKIGAQSEIYWRNGADHFSVTASGQPFWEAIRDWYRPADKSKVDQNPKTTKSETPPEIRISAGQSRPEHRSNNNSPGLIGSPGGRGYVLAPGNKAAEGRAYASWPLLMTANEITRLQGAVIKSRPNDPMRWHDGMEVHTNAYLEPKIQIKDGVISCRIDEALDDQGVDLRNEDRDTLSLSMNATNSTPLSIPLQAPRGEATRLKSLKGTLAFSVVTHSEEWIITDLQTPTRKMFSRNGFPFNMQFAGIQRTDKGWVVKFVQEEKGRLAVAAGQQWANWFNNRRYGLDGFIDIGIKMEFNEEIFSSFKGATIGIGLHYHTSLQNGSGKEIRPSDGVGNVEDFVFVAEHTRPVAPGTASSATALSAIKRIVLQVPTQWREVTVPFEFKDLPLPPP